MINTETYIFGVRYEAKPNSHRLLFMQVRPLFRPVSGFLMMIVWLVISAASGTVSAQPVDQRAEALFQTGVRHFEANLFANAVERFDRLRREFPDHDRSVDAMYYQAESYLALGREDDAIRLLEEFDTKYPTHPFAFGTRLSLGKFFFERGDYEQAITTLAQVLDRSPTAQQSATALYWMGESAVQLGRTEEAFGYFRRITDRFPDTTVAPRAAYAIAFNQVQLGRYDQAALSFERLAAQFPNSEFARNIGLALGEVYYEINDYERAAREIEKQMPNLQGEARDRAIFLLSESYNQLRNSERAILNYRHFTEGDTNNPYYVRALYGLAWNYHHEGSYQWAADNFRLVVESGNRELGGESMYYEAVNLRLSESIPAAITGFRAFVDAWPDHELADHGWYELGMLLYEQRRWAESNGAFTKLIQNYPQSGLMGDALAQQGYTFVALGNFDGALQAFDRAVQLDAAPDSLKQAVIFQKAWLLYRYENYEEASTEFLALFNENSSGPDAAKALFYAAESFFQQDRYERAEALFNRYLNDYPGGQLVEAAHYALGWTYFRQRNYQAAIPQFESFLESYKDVSETVPYRSDARLRLADSYFALKQYPQAVRVYGQMAADGDDYSLYQIGQAYSNSGNAFEAISTFRNLLDTFPSSEWRAEAQYSLGYLYFLNQEYEQAREAYQTLIDTFPTDPLAAKAQYGIGDAYFNAGEIGSAIAAYNLVLRKYPNSPFVADAASGIQFALMADGQDDRADAVIDSLANAMAGSGVGDQLRFRQAETKYQSGRVDEALEDFRSFVRNTDDSPFLADTYFYMGSIHKDRNESREAASYFERIVNEYPTSDRFPIAARELGHIRLEQGRFQEADDLFVRMERSRASDPRNVAEARYGRSLALRQLGRQDEAQTLLNEAIEAAPMSDATYPAYLGLARVQLASGNESEAVRLLNLVASRSLDETGAEALYLLGEHQYQQGSYNQAIETLGRMSTLFAGYYEWMARSYHLQGRAFEALSQTGDAVQMYQRVLSDYPDATVADEARSRIDELE